ncbi:MAG: glycosyltransferase family 39 protein [Paracoccaceae bacterium]
MHADRRDYLVLAAILLVALAFRLPGLNSQLWFDEITTVVTHLRLPWSQMMTDYSMNHHYFHDIFAKGLREVFGEAPWAIRMTALVFGLASIAAAWELARRVGGIGLAHVSALLLAVSYHHIWFSQNARGYTGLAFFGTWGLILFLKGLKEPRLSTWAWFGLTLTLTVFTHLTGAFLYVAFGLVWLWHAARGGPRGLWLNPFLGFLGGGVAAIVVYLPILPSLLGSIGGVAATSGVDVMQEYQSPIWTAVEAVRTGLGSGSPLVPVVGAVTVALILTGAVALRRTAPVFAPTVLLHIAVTVAILMAVGMRVWPRFFFVDIAFLMILIAAGVRWWSSWLGRRIDPVRAPGVVFALAAAAMVAVSLPLAARNYAHPKQDLAGAFDLVETTRKPDERVYAVGFAASAFTDFYSADWAVIMDEPEYRAALAEPGPVTFVVGFPGRSMRRIPQMEKDAGTVLRETWFRGTLGEGAVAVLRRE